MSINDADAYQGNDAVESTDGPRVFDSPAEYRATREVDYGQLVAAVADARDMDAAEAKAHISRVGRETAIDAVYSDIECKRIMADGGEVPACPECDKASARKLVGDDFNIRRRSEHDYYCNKCGARFDEPNYREANGGTNVNGLARKLDKADPDWSGGEPLTDGGVQWHPCVCGAEYRSRRAALRCCGDRL